MPNNIRMPPAPLVQAQSVLEHAAPALADLRHVTNLLSAFLDVSVNVCLQAAGSRRSTALLERVAARLMSDCQCSAALLRHWFAGAMQAAITNDDLAMVQKIHALHPAPLALYSLDLAIAHGSLELVQWLIAYRHDRLCCAAGVTNLCIVCLFKAIESLSRRDSFRIVKWLTSQGFPLAFDRQNDSIRSWASERALLLSLDTTLWYEAQGLLSDELSQRLMAMVAHGDGVGAIDGDVLTYFVKTRSDRFEPGYLMELLPRIGCQPDYEAVADVVLSLPQMETVRDQITFAATRPGGAKVLQPSRAFLATHGNAVLEELAIQAAIYGHYDTVQWLFEQHGVRPSELGSVTAPGQDDLLRFYEWKQRVGLDDWTPEDMDTAAQYGYLEVVQWLHIHSNAGCTTQAMDTAAVLGHLHVVQWLHEHRTEGCTEDAFVHAATNGHLEVLQWLCLHYPMPNATELLGAAAHRGQLEVLEWLYKTHSDACTACATGAVLESGFINIEKLNAHDALCWLREHPPHVDCERSCRRAASDPVWLGRYAASYGDVQLLEYILQHHPDSVPSDGHESNALRSVAGRGGHQGLALWLHKHPSLQ